jgi:hypothetical protein
MTCGALAPLNKAQHDCWIRTGSVHPAPRDLTALPRQRLAFPNLDQLLLFQPRRVERTESIRDLRFSGTFAADAGDSVRRVLAPASSGLPACAVEGGGLGGPQESS